MNLSDPANLLIAGIYFVAAGILTFFSIFGVYVLIRYGKSTLLSFTVSVFYTFVFISILGSSYQTLQTILQ
jgi:hypothetical protein